VAKFPDNSEYKKAKIIRHNLLYAVAAPMIYQSWGFAYGLKHAGETLDGLRETGRVDVTALDVEHLDALDFGLWSDEPDDPAHGLRLIPVWLYPFLKPGQTLTSIDGSTTVVGDDYTNSSDPGYIDNDNRGGFIAYGVIPK
jgi:hypothetical protein